MPLWRERPEFVLHALEDVFRTIERCRNNGAQEVHIMTFCKSGRHRAVAGH